MSVLIGNILAYLAGLAFVAGITYRLWLWGRTPSPLRIPTTPAPKSYTGVLCRLLGEVLLFRSLFRADKALWATGMVFHLCLLCTLLRHLRYFVVSVPVWVNALAGPAAAAGVLLMVVCVLLLVQRVGREKLRYVSTASDYFVLVLIFLIAFTGIMLRYCHRVSLIDVKDYALSLVTFAPAAPPAHGLFLLHIMFVFLLLAYFPYSKLLHAGAVVFSPSRYQRDNPREKPHVNPWDPGDHVN